MWYKQEKDDKSHADQMMAIQMSPDVNPLLNSNNKNNKKHI